MMENTYGIGVKNRYELFYDEDVDPLEIIREREEAKEKRKTDKTQSKDKAKNVKVGKTVTPSGLSKKTKENPAASISKCSVEATEASNKSRQRLFPERSTKSSRNFDESKDVDDRKNFRNKEEYPAGNSENRERDSEVRRGRGGFRGRGRPRGRGNFFNSEARPPRREFDRHSGNGKGGFRPVEKRDGAGSNNWSDMHSDFNSRKREPDSTWDEEFEPSGDKHNDSNWDSITENYVVPPNINRDEAPVEKSAEEPSTIEKTESKENLPISDERSDEGMREMTLDEWKREQESKRVVPKYNLRKPGEGEDGNQWKKLYVLKKKVKEDGEEEDEEEEEEDVDDEEFGRRGRHRQLVDIQINFNDSRRGRGRARGGRGGIGPRSVGAVGNKDVHREERREPLSGSNVGGRSYRNMKMNKSGQQSAPRVDDWNDFPSLVTA